MEMETGGEGTSIQYDKNDVTSPQSPSSIPTETPTQQPGRNAPKVASISRKAAVMAACLVLQMTTIGIGYGLNVMYVEIMEVFRIDRMQAALMQSFYTCIMTGAGIFWGSMIERFGPGLCVMMGSALAVSGLLASAFARSHVTVIICTGVVAGNGMGTCYLATYIAIAWVFHDSSNLSLVLILLSLGSSLGQLCIPYMFELLIEWYSWRGCFLIISGLALQNLPSGFLIFSSKDFYFNTKATVDKEEIKPDTCDFKVLRDPILVLVLISCLLLASTGSVEVRFIVDIMMIRGFQRQTGALMLTIIGTANLLGRAVGVALRLKCSVPTIYHWAYISVTLATCHILTIRIFHFWPLLIACSVYGVAFGITVAQVPAIVLEAIGLQQYTSGMSFVNLMYGFGNLTCGLLGGFIKDTTGQYDTMFYISASVSVYISVSALAIVWMIRRKEAALSPAKDSSPYERLP